MPNFKNSDGFKMKGFSKHQTSDLIKKQTGPRATPKKSKEVAGDVDLSPGFEDPIKIQKVQREGLTPDSQKFHKKAKEASSPAKHYVDDVKEHNADGHPDNLQGPEEHKQWKAKKPKKSTTSAHGQIEDAQTEYETDKKILKKKSPNKQKPKRARKKGKDYKVHSKSGKVEKMGLGGTKVTSNKKQFDFGGSPAKIDPPKDSDRYGDTTRGETKKKMKSARKAHKKAKTSEGRAKAQRDYYKALF